MSTHRGDPTSALQLGVAHLEGLYGLGPDPKLALYQIQLAVNLNDALDGVAASDSVEGAIPPLSPVAAGRAKAFWLPLAKGLCTSVHLCQRSHGVTIALVCTGRRSFDNHTPL